MEQPITARSTSTVLKALDVLPTPVAVTDSEFRILHFNAAFWHTFQFFIESAKVPTFSEMFENFQNRIQSYTDNGLPASRLLQFEIAALKITHTDRFFDIRLNRTPEEHDLPEGFTVSFTEVTDREREMIRYKELAEQHLTFIKHTTSGIMIHRNGRLVYVNEQGAKMVRARDSQSLIGRSVLEFVTEEFKNIVVERINRMQAEQTPVEPIEEVIIREDKTVFPAEIFAYPVVFEGAPAIKVIIQDISLRKNVEKDLQDSRQQFSNLIHSLQDVVFIVDRQAHITFINEAWTALTGFDVKETLGKSILLFIYDPREAVDLYQQVKDQFRTGVLLQDRELKIRTLNEGDKFIQVKFSAQYDTQQNIVGITGLVHDIHRRKVNQLELEQIESNLRIHQQIYVSLAKSHVAKQYDFIDSLKEIVTTSAKTLDLDRVNVWQLNDDQITMTCLVNFDTLSNQFTHESETVSEFGRYINIIREERIVNADDAKNDPRVSDFLETYILPHGVQSMMDAGIFIGDRMWGVICFDSVRKQKHWSVEDRTFAANLADMISILYESTEKKKTQLALDRSLRLKNTILENASDAILLVDKDGRIAEVNRMAALMSLYAEDEMIGLHVADFLPPELKVQGLAAISRVETNKTYRKNWSVVRKDASKMVIEVSASKFEDGSILAIVRDVSERIEQEKALRESQIRLDLALKGADLATWDFYIQENKIIHNQNWGKMLGYDFELTTVTKQFWQKLIHPSDIGAALEAFDLHAAGQTPYYEVKIRMLCSNGEWRWVLDKGKVVEWDKDGNPVRATGINQDITALKEYEAEIAEQRQFLNEIINAIPYPLYVRNANDDFVVVNNAFAAFVGEEKNTILQYKFNKRFLFKEGLRKLLEHDHEILLTREPMLLQENLMLNASTGEEHLLQTIKVPLKDANGQVQEVLSVSSDVTSWYQQVQHSKEEMDVIQAKLSDRVALLEGLNKEIETFHYSVSHDLRTPLRTIDIFAYFLEKNFAAQLDKEGKDNIQQIRKSITKMGALIDNLLVYIRMGKVVMRKEWISLDKLVAHTLTELSRDYTLGDLTILRNELSDVYADATMLQHALYNLLSNAIKFSSLSKKPEVKIETQVKEQFVEIIVSDNGVGFSMEYKDKLFKAFKRLHSEEHFDGSGVGLAIVEKIVTRHGGEIWAESIPGSSTSFFIKLPLKD